MKLAWAMGIGCALLLHAIVLLFGGILFPKDEGGPGKYQEVDLLSDAEDTKKELEEKKPEDDQEVRADQEQPPDAAEIIRGTEAVPNNDAPALEAASLAAIEAALNGAGGGGGDFAESLQFASGGRIGGTGKGGALEEKMDTAFSLAEIDQKPRAIFQASPTYPAELRDKKVEGSVNVIFVVDENGKVVDPRVEKSTHAAFEKPALEAVRQWKFEAAVKAGQRVRCKMRVPIRFQPR